MNVFVEECRERERVRRARESESESERRGGMRAGKEEDDSTESPMRYLIQYRPYNETRPAPKVKSDFEIVIHSRVS